MCGMLKGFEKWCRDIAHIAEDAHASKTHGAGEGTFYRDVGDSLQMIDEAEKLFSFFIGSYFHAGFTFRISIVVLLLVSVGHSYLPR